MTSRLVFFHPGPKWLYLWFNKVSSLILAILAAQSQASSNAKNKLKLKWELIFRCKTRWRFNVCCPVDVSVFNKE